MMICVAGLLLMSIVMAIVSQPREASCRAEAAAAGAGEYYINPITGKVGWRWLK